MLQAGYQGEFVMKWPALFFIASFLIFETASCGRGQRPSASEVSASALATLEMPNENRNTISQSALRNVLFDHTVLGCHAADPLILSKVGMMYAVVELEEGTAMDKAEAAQIRRQISVASKKIASLQIKEKVWARIYHEVPGQILTAAYEIARSDGYRRCAKTDVAQMLLIDTAPEKYFENIQVGNTAPIALTPLQDASIDAYLEREAEFLNRVDSEMAYWTALGVAFIMKQTIDSNLLFATQKKERMQAALATLISELRDENHFIRNCSSATSLLDRKSELSAIFRECDTADAAVYWEFTSSVAYQSFHHATWDIFYSTMTAAMKQSLGL